MFWAIPIKTIFGKILCSLIKILSYMNNPHSKILDKLSRIIYNFIVLIENSNQAKNIISRDYLYKKKIIQLKDIIWDDYKNNAVFWNLKFK